MSEIIIATNHLKSLITDEDFKYVDSVGVSPLIKKAQFNSELSPLGAEKKFEEMVVCNLVKHFDSLNQLHFTELEAYIVISNFSLDKIFDEFKEYVHTKEIKEDLVLKAYIVRMTQNINPKYFGFDYLISRFKELEKLDPWLFSELIIAVNWNKGVEMISLLLKKNYDASYLFSIIPALISKNKKSDISSAFNSWYNFLLEDDRELADYYVENYGIGMMPKRNIKIQSNRRRNTVRKEMKKRIKNYNLNSIVEKFDMFNRSMIKQGSYYMTLPPSNFGMKKNVKEINM